MRLLIGFLKKFPRRDILHVTLQLPAYGRSTQDGSRATIERGNQELGFATENIHHMAVVAVFYRLHDEVAGLGETAKEDKGLGTTECGKVGTSRLIEELSKAA